MAEDPYELFLTEPAGWRFAGADAVGATMLGTEREGAVRVSRLGTAQSGGATWRVRYERAP